MSFASVLRDHPCPSESSFGHCPFETLFERSPVLRKFGFPSTTTRRVMLFVTVSVLLASTVVILIWQMFTKKKWDPKGQVASLAC